MIAAWDEGIGPPALPVSSSQRALLAVGFWLILRLGVAVPQSRLAATTGLPAGSVASDLAGLAAIGRVRLTPSGDVLASLGLTLIPTNHQVRVGQAPRYTLCGLDAVGILGALDADGRIDSINRVTGARFGIDFAAGAPKGYDRSWVLFVMASRPVASVVDQWCPMVNFFEDAATASAWAASQGIAGECMAIPDATRFGSRLWRQALGLRV